MSYSCLILSVKLSKATASARQPTLSPIKACSKGILEGTWWHEPKVHLQNQLRPSRGCLFQSLQVPSADPLSLEYCRTRLTPHMTRVFLSAGNPPALAQAMRPRCSFGHTPHFSAAKSVCPQLKPLVLCYWFTAVYYLFLFYITFLREVDFCYLDE